jgi:hypothetical protein
MLFFGSSHNGSLTKHLNKPGGSSASRLRADTFDTPRNTACRWPEMATEA